MRSDFFLHVGRKFIRPEVVFLAMGAVLLGSLSMAETAEEEVAPSPKVLSLQETLVLGLERNFDLEIQSLDIPIGTENIIIEDAQFDPVLEAAASTRYEKLPTASAFSSDIFDTERIYSGEAGLRKRFPLGLESRVTFETERSTNNSSITGLRPQYRSFLLLDFTQPLLRDFGVGVNTTELRLSQNRRQQALYVYLTQAQTLTEEIEIAYYELARAAAVIGYRLESLELARELLEGNRQRFQAGTIPISEVNESETAVAAREEELLFARQQFEQAANNLKDLLEMDAGTPLEKIEIRTQPLPAPHRTYPDYQEALAKALQYRPELDEIGLEVRNRNIQLKFLENQKLPRLDLDATLGVNGLSGEERRVTFAGIEARPAFEGKYIDSVDRMASGDGYEWFAGLIFSYPLGNREAEARFRRAGWEKRQAVYRLKSLENTIITEVKNTLVEVERSLERVEVARRFEDLAEVTVSQETERLKEGLSDTFRVLEFQRALINSRIRRVTALADFQKGLAQYYRAMGLNLEKHDIVPRFHDLIRKSPNPLREEAEKADEQERS